MVQRLEELPELTLEDIVVDEPLAPPVPPIAKPPAPAAVVAKPPALDAAVAKRRTTGAGLDLDVDIDLADLDDTPDVESAIPAAVVAKVGRQPAFANVAPSSVPAEAQRMAEELLSELGVGPEPGAAAEVDTPLLPTNLIDEPTPVMHAPVVAPPSSAALDLDALLADLEQVEPVTEPLPPPPAPVLLPADEVTPSASAEASAAVARIKPAKLLRERSPIEEVVPKHLTTPDHPLDPASAAPSLPDHAPGGEATTGAPPALELPRVDHDKGFLLRATFGPLPSMPIIPPELLRATAVAGMRGPPPPPLEAVADFPELAAPPIPDASSAPDAPLALGTAPDPAAAPGPEMVVVQPDDLGAPSLPLSLEEPPARPKIPPEALQPDPATFAALRRLAGPAANPDVACATLRAAVQGDAYDPRQLPDLRPLVIALARVAVRQGMSLDDLLAEVAQAMFE